MCLAPWTPLEAVGMTTVVFTGRSGATALGALCDVVLATPSDFTPRIQEGHEFAYHVIAAMVEQRLFGQRPSSATCGGDRMIAATPGIDGLLGSRLAAAGRAAAR